MALSVILHLRKLWEDFLLLPRDFNYRHIKSQKLEKFLRAAVRTYEAHDGIMLAFSDMRSVSGLLVQEFMLDIQHLCNSAKTENDVSRLKDYLISGRGCLILHVLHTIGVQGISASKEFTRLLLSLFQVCSKFSCTRNSTEEVKLLQIENCFPSRQSLKQYPKFHYTFPQKSSPNKNVQLPRRASMVATKRKLSKTSIVFDSSESSDADGRGLSVSQTAKLESYNSGSTMALNIASHLGIIPGLLKCTEDSESTDDGISSPPHMQKKPLLDVHPYEICTLILSIIVSMCYDHMNLRTCRETIWHTASTLLTQHFLDLHLLITVSDAPLPNGWKPTDFYCLQRYLLRIALFVFTQLSLSEDCPCGSSDFSLGGLIPVMDIARHVLENFDILTVASSENMEKGFHSIILASEILIGCNCFLTALFESITTSSSRFSNAIYIFRQLCHYGLFALFEKLAIVVEQLPDVSQGHHNRREHTLIKNYQLLSQMINSFGGIIAAIKSCRMAFMHKKRCDKRNHRHCEICRYRDHHCSLFGITTNVINDRCFVPDEAFSEDHMAGASPNGMAKPNSKCAISIIVEQLLQWYQRSLSTNVRQLLLNVLRVNGVCCCILPETLIATLLTGISQQSEQFIDLVLVTLHHILLNNLGGSSYAEQHIPCTTCNTVPPTINRIQKCEFKATTDMPSVSKVVNCPAPIRLNSDSALSGSEGGAMRDDHTNSRWQCLRFYKELLVREELPFSIKVAKHISRLASDAKSSLLIVLYEEVIWPIVQEGFSGIMNISNFIKTNPVIMRTCISVLTFMLLVAELRHKFLKMGGITWLTRVLNIAEYQQCCLQLVQVLLRDNNNSEELETAILPVAVKISTPAYIADLESSGETVIIRTPSPVPSELALNHSISFSSEDIYRSCKLTEAYLLADTVIDILYHSLDEVSQQFCQISNNEVQYYETAVNVSSLRFAADLWISCNRIACSSKVFIKQFLSQGGLNTALNFLSTSISELKKCIKNGVKVGPLAYVCWLDMVKATVSLCLFFSKTREKFTSEYLNIEHLVMVLQDAMQMPCVATSDEENLLKDFCDLLLHCAVSSMEENICDFVVEKNNNLILFGDINQEVEDSSEDDGKETIEPGYDADVDSDVDEASLQKVCSSNSALFELAYPQVACLAVRLALSQFPASSQLPSVQIRSTICHVLLKVISIAKLTSDNAEVLYKQGIGEILMTDCKQALISLDPQLRALQNLVLELLLVLWQTSLSAKEFSLFLSILKEQDCPRDVLLSTLIAVTKAHSLQPSTHLSMPIVQTTVFSEIELSLRSVNSDTVSVSMHVEPSRSIFTDDRDEDVNNMIQTNDTAVEAVELDECIETEFLCNERMFCPNHIAPIQLPLGGCSLWPAAKKGFSISMWLHVKFDKPELIINESQQRVKRGSSVQMQLPAKFRQLLHLNEKANVKSATRPSSHLISYGNKDIMFEVWFDADLARLLIRLVGHKNCEEHILAQVSTYGMLTLNAWQHITISFSERNESSQLNIANVCIVVDGYNQRDLLLEYKPFNAQSVTNSTLYLGHSLLISSFKASKLRWQIGNLMLFRDCHLSKHMSFYLCALGPDCQTISHCDSSELYAAYAFLITEHFVKNSGLSYDVFTDNHSAFLKQLQESIVLVYNPRNTTHFNFYPPAKIALPETDDVVSHEDQVYQLNQLPCVQPAIIINEVAPHVRASLAKCIDELGGIGVFLMLFARVVEQSSSETQQAESLNLLLTLIRQNPEHAIDFEIMSGPQMLSKILVTKQCIIGFPILRNLISACLSKPIIRYNSITKQYEVDEESDAVIVDVKIVAQVLLMWQIWERAEAAVSEMIFKILFILVRPQHPMLNFNIKQLQTASIVKRLLNACLERIQDGCPPFTNAVCENIIRIVKQLVGDPPDIHHVIAICDFLLLAHPAANAYVFHAELDFYFMPKWITNACEVSSSLKDSAVDFHLIFDKAYGRDKYADKMAASGKKLEWNDDVSDNSLYNGKHSEESFENASKKSYENESTSQNAVISVILNQSACDLLKNSKNTGTKLVTTDNLLCNTNDETEQVVISNDVTVIHDPNISVTKDEVDADKLASISSEKRPIKTNSRIYELLKLSNLIQKDSNNKESSKEVHHRSSLPSSQRAWMLEETDSVKDLHLKHRSSLPLQGLLAHSRHSVDSASKDSKTAMENELDISEKMKKTDWQLYPNVTTDEQVPEKLGRFALNIAEHNEVEDGPVLICSGLIMLLSDVLKILTQEQLLQIREAVLRPEVLIILAHHNAEEIRVATVKLLDTLMQLAQKKHLETFEKIQGCVLLANQLHGYAANQVLVEAIFSFYLGTSVTLDTEIDSEIISRMPSSRRSAIFTVLAVVENTLNDEYLCMHILENLHKVLIQSTLRALDMFEAGLIETALNILSRIACFEEYNETSIRNHKGIITALHKLLVSSAVKMFSSRGQRASVHFEEMLLLLHVFEAFHDEMIDQNCKASVKIRAIQTGIYVRLIDFITKKMEQSSSIDSAGSRLSLADAVHSFINRLAGGPAGSKLRASPEQTQLGQLSENQLGKEFNSKSRFQHRRTFAGILPDLGPMTVPVERKEASSFTDVIVDDTNLNTTGFQNDGEMWLFGNARITLGSATDSLQKPYNQKFGERSRSFVLDINADEESAAMEWNSNANYSQDSSDSEFFDRLKKVTVAAVDFVIFSNGADAIIIEQPSENVPNIIDDDVSKAHVELLSETAVITSCPFSDCVLDFIMHGLNIGMAEKSSSTLSRSSSNSAFWRAKDIFKIQFYRLIIHQMAPWGKIENMLSTIQTLLRNASCFELLRLLINFNVNAGIFLAHTLNFLVSVCSDKLTQEQRDHIDELNDHLYRLGYSNRKLGQPVSAEQASVIDEERKLWYDVCKRDKEELLKRKEASMLQVVGRMRKLCKKVEKSALMVTQSAAVLQAEERKKFIAHIKHKIAQGVQIKKSWQDLVQQLTHERAVWYDASTYPPSWQLDPTEGPCRVRKRLMRCHLGIDERFVQPIYRSKLGKSKLSPPFNFLFEENDGQNSLDAAAIVFKLHTSETVPYSGACSHVTPFNETPGVIVMGQNDLYFVGDEALEELEDAKYNKEVLFIQLPYGEIKEVHNRWYQLKDTAVEIFLVTGRTYLIAFNTSKERDTMVSILNSMELPSLVTEDNLETVLQRWLSRKITNFEYLMYLNKVAGRSFNDLMQYPVFPFVLADYTSENIDLEDISIYRNLTKPIAVQCASRENKYIDTYKWLELESQRIQADTSQQEYHTEPYHYGSHYSNSGTVLHFLVRLPPFTQMFLSYQDNSFDIPDRTFHSLKSSWRLASFESMTDVKELIPEFFYLPDFFLNSEGYDFGMRQTGEPVSNVILPPWCKGNPRTFILVHRQALESDIVTQHLAGWIDLVFGYKQTGKAAIEAINVFHPATYFGMDVENIADEVRKNAIKTMIKTYGQTPKQLFRNPHPTPVIQKIENLSGNDSHRKTSVSPVPGVKGIKWGQFVGSPDTPEAFVPWWQEKPVDCLSQTVISSLVVLPSEEVFGLPPSSYLLVLFTKFKEMTSDLAEVSWAAIISWGYADNIIRIKNRKEMPPRNFIHWCLEEQPTCCCATPDCRLLFFGTSSGVLMVYKIRFNRNKKTHLQVFSQQRLLGHSAPIVAIHMCRPYSILISASVDCSCIIWDLNRLTYVRTIEDHKHAIRAVIASATSGDIITSSHSDHGSTLMLHTVNAQLVARVNCIERILSLAISTRPEGTSVNVIAGGLNTGSIRLWSSWDLTVLCDLNWSNYNKPILCVAFSNDSQRLFAANTDGMIAMWKNPSAEHPNDVSFIPFV